MVTASDNANDTPHSIEALRAAWYRYSPDRKGEHPINRSDDLRPWNMAQQREAQRQAA